MNIFNLHNYSVYSELHVAIEFNKQPKQIDLEIVAVTEVIEHRISVAFGLGRRKFCHHWCLSTTILVVFKNFPDLCHNCVEQNATLLCNMQMLTSFCFRYAVETAGSMDMKAHCPELEIERRTVTMTSLLSTSKFSKDVFVA